MLRNYFAATFRNIARNKLTAAINILGLAVGFTAAMLIALYARDEFTFDTWIPGHENVYRLAKELRPPGVAPLLSDAAGPVEGAWFAALPQVVAATRLWPENRSLRHGAVEAIESIVWAEANVFEVFPLPVIDGSLDGALTAPASVVLTRATARKYFGTDRAVGETLEVDRTHLLTVTAVLDDLPERSHLDLRVMISINTPISPMMTTEAVNNPSIGLGPLLTYLKLRPGTLDEVRAAAPGLLDRHTKGLPFGPGKTIPTKDVVTYEYQPLAGIHMISQAGRAAQTPSSVLRRAGDPGIVRALILTGVLLLFIAVANFTNLMTAHAPRRSVEIGVRKSVGALRRDLMVQFLGESFLYAGVALIVAVAAVALLLPSVSSLIGREIGVADNGPWLAIAPAALLLTTGLLGGAYPAYVLSRFGPASALKVSAHSGREGGALREILVIGQFAVLIGLIVATVIIGRQTAYVTQNSIRAESDQLVIAGSPCTEEFRVKVSALQGVRGASCVSRSLFGGFGGMRLITNPDGTQFNLHNVFADPGALELYGLAPVAGRFFQPGDDQTRVIPGRGPRARRVLINETAARKLGFASADAALGDDVHGQSLDIVGVVPDFQIAVRSPKDPIEAIMFSPASMVGGMAGMDPPFLLIKLDGARIGETVRGIDAAWESLGVNRPITRTFVDQHIEAQFLELTRQTEAFNGFSMISVFIACLGLFGLSAHRAESRTKEIGIRKTMGASSADVLRLLLWQFTRPVLWANLIAWPAAYVIMQRWLEGFAYRIALAPWMFLAATAAALAIALATVIGHALLVARARPVAALRYE